MSIRKFNSEICDIRVGPLNTDILRCRIMAYWRNHEEGFKELWLYRQI